MDNGKVQNVLEELKKVQ